jgi:hypothetical protein
MSIASWDDHRIGQGYVVVEWAMNKRKTKSKAYDVVTEREGDSKHSFKYEFILAIAKVHVKRCPGIIFLVLPRLFSI